MALKKDKQKVLGEVFDDQRVRSFLEIEELEGSSTDFRLLERAYRSMKAENFSTFINFFVEAGHDINAKNPSGISLLQLILQHSQASDYCDALKKNGARV